MRRLRFAVLNVLIAAIWLFSAADPNPASAAEPKAKVLFNWAFGALVGDEAQRQLVGIVRDTKLTNGDQFKMLVELKEKCFVYVVYYSGQGEIQLLFPGDVGQFSETTKSRKSTTSLKVTCGSPWMKKQGSRDFTCWLRPCG